MNQKATYNICVPLAGCWVTQTGYVYLPNKVWWNGERITYSYGPYFS